MEIYNIILTLKFGVGKMYKTKVVSKLSYQIKCISSEVSFEMINI